MKRVLATLFGAALLLSGFGVVSASADPGPNGNNDKGLCTAYFNGQKTGHNKDGKESPGPFAALEAEADPDGEADAGTAAQAALVNEYCRTMAGLDGEGIDIEGNGNENGRFDCADGTEEDFSCTDNPAPNEGKGRP